MKMLGEYRIPAPRAVVWESLNDPTILAKCLNGCERLEKLSATQFEGVVTFKIGPIKPTFACTIELSEIDPPNAYVISVMGKGGTAGFAKGSAKVQLIDDKGITILGYTVDARLGGKLGQMGGRVVDPVARKIADEFFGNLAQAVGATGNSSAVTETQILPQ